MTESTRPLPRSEREALRSLLMDALADLPNAEDPDRAAYEAMRALDAYLEAHGSALVPPSAAREAPVADFEHSSDLRQEMRWARWVVVGLAVLATATVVVTLSGGWIAGAVVLGIWAVAMLGLLNT